MHPEDLSRELGLEASHSFRAGEPRAKRSTDLLPASVHGGSYWLGTLDATCWPADTWLSGFINFELAQKTFAKAATRDLGSAIAFGAVRFLRSKATLLERIDNEGGQTSLLVSFEPTAVDRFSLTPEVTRVFSELKVTVEFEMTND